MRFLSLALILLLVTGCDRDDTPTVADDPAAFDNDFEQADEFDDMDDPDAAEWQAMLQGQSGFEAVSGRAVAHPMDERTHVTASLSGAEANATHPWHVHTGSCGSGGGIVGSAGAYPALEVGDDGQASAEATIEVVLQPAESYHVNVHASPDNMATIVACGDLTQN
jgi:superoxide dismutase, Cu-Zn family